MQQTNADFLKDLLKNLGKQITPQWRVQQFSDQKPFAVVIPYLDKVDVMKQLDQYATYGWHREHYTINHDVYCRIGIVFPDNSIQWRSDVGTKGQVEEEKTKASDSFKRAGSNWNIGRNLSETDIVRVNTNLPLVKGAAKPYVINSRGERVYDITKFVNEQIKAGILKVENIFGNDNSEDKAPETKAPPAEKAKKQAPPVKEAPAKESQIKPSNAFDTPADTKPASKGDDAARATALGLFQKLEQSVVLAYLIKDKKIVKYATVTDFVNNHDLAEVRAIYTELTAKKS